MSKFEIFSIPDPKKIFVFGSNLVGIHGAGAAKAALDHCGAIYGQGIGIQGRSYGIPTKGHNLEVLPLGDIAKHVLVFMWYASNYPKETFVVTPIGTGLSGYPHSVIMPLFEGAPSNCELPEVWTKQNAATEMQK